MTTDATTLTTNPPDSPWQQLMRRLDTIPAGQLRDLAADIAMEAYLLGIEKEASRHINAGKVVSPTGRPPRASAGASLVSGEYDEAAAHHDALLRQVEQARAENARLRSQLAEAREMAAVDAEIIDDLRAAMGLSPGQSLTKAVTQLRDDLAWLRRQVLVVAADLERYSDLPMSERKLAWTLRQIVAGERPETAPESPQTDEQAQVWADTHTGAETGAQEPLDTAAVRARWLAPCGPCDAGYPTACTCPTADPRNVIAALVTELDQLRAEIDQYATQMERAAGFAAQSGAWSGQIIALYERHADRLRRMLTATAPETGPESPHTADPAPERVEASTDHLGDADGAVAYWHTEISEILADWLTEEQRTGWQRLASDVAEQIISDLGIAGMAAERDRLRTEAAVLRARVREWEAVHADLAARCDSGDIPIRLGERYSLAVLREIDRLRTERDRLRRRLGDVLDLEELPEDHTIVAAVRRLRAERDALRAEVERAREIAHSYRHEIGAAQVFDVLEAALGSTPDTGSTNG